MKDIMKLELFQLKKSKLFWIMLALSFALPIFSMLLVLMFLAAFNITLGPLNALFESIPLITIFLQSMAEISSISGILALITMGVVLGKEFSGGTVRNIITANKSRRALFFSYFFVSLIVGVSYFLCHFMAIMLVGAPIFGFSILTAKQSLVAVFSSLGIGMLALIFTQSCVCMFLFCVRKQWAAIVLPLLIVVLVPSVFTLIVNMYSNVLLAGGMTTSYHSLYWVPFANLSLFFPASADGELIGAIVMYYVIFITVFIVSGYFTFKKADLK